MEHKATQVNQVVDQSQLRDQAIPVSRVVSINDVKIIACNASIESTGAESEQQIQLECKTRTISEGTSINVFVEFSVESTAPSTIGLKLEFTLMVSYNNSSDIKFTQDQLVAFGALNGVFNAWPYCREFVQSMTTRMGLPALTIPVHRPNVVGVSTGSPPVESLSKTAVARPGKKSGKPKTKK